jgi:formylglycine-generating enzyme required for sulfatase activity
LPEDRDDIGRARRANASAKLADSLQPTESFSGDVPLAQRTTLRLGGDEDDGDDGRGDAPVTDRYTFVQPIGEGGFAEVWRVVDAVLQRPVAMKIVHLRLLTRQDELRRFFAEARATARLQHPNIVPVYDMGQLDDGRAWFTMQEVHGETLGWWIRANAERGDGLAFRRLVTVMLSVVRGVAHAHQHGVVHRDLKPSNVMVGAQGEVYVLDWGIAKLLGQPSVTGSGAPSAHGHTQDGWVAGTPAYMPPEQALGLVDQIDERADVYALGAMMFEVLEGRPPYLGGAREVLADVVAGPPPPPWAGHPPELLAWVARAMARAPRDRFRDATEMVAPLQGWLDGAQRREQATAMAVDAVARQAEVETARQEAAALRARGEALLRSIPAWADEEEKAEAWRLLDEADAQAQVAALADLGVEQALHGALRVAPDLPEAHAALLARYRVLHTEAERRRDDAEAQRLAARMAPHVAALSPRDPVRVRAEAYLEGSGALTLLTEPAGAEVFLFRYVLRRRRLVEVFDRWLGSTPLRAVSLPRGSYVCVVRHPDAPPVRLPVEIQRLAHEEGLRPGDGQVRPLRLPGTLGADEVFVPAGWFAAGGDGYGLSPRRLWCDSFVIQRVPVTNQAYLAFLDDLVAKGRSEEALRAAPRERGAVPGELGPLLLAFDGQHFALRPDAQGDEWGLDWPVVQVDWFGARAYAAWCALREKKPWRLPSEFEWEKAARGVDGRRYPWGDSFDLSRARLSGSTPGRHTPGPVEEYPLDESPYGVRGMAGNVQDWCAEAYLAPPPPDGGVVPIPSVDDADEDVLRAARGGAWDTLEMAARCGGRTRSQASYRSWLRGFRLARSVR